MAERRMFAKTIVESDAFLDMPISTQALYFHLGMSADDDGFVGSPKKVIRECNASEDDLKVLLAKRFILGFDSGIVVIKHWKMNNYLQKDRYKQTVYIDEKNKLITKDNGSYTDCIQNVYKLDTQDSIGKISLELDKSKNRVSIELGENDQATATLVKFYEDNIGTLTPISAQKLLSYLDDLSEEVIEKAIELASLRNKRNTNYIIGILNSWIKKGYKTLGDIEEEQKNKSTDDVEKRVMEALYGR